MFCRIEEMQAKESGLLSEQQKLTEDLAEAHERLMAETNAHQGSVERVEAASRELEMMKVELNAARQNIEKAQYDKARVSLALTSQELHFVKATADKTMRPL